MTKSQITKISSANSFQVSNNNSRVRHWEGDLEFLTHDHSYTVKTRSRILTHFFVIQYHVQSFKKFSTVQRNFAEIGLK